MRVPIFIALWLSLLLHAWSFDTDLYRQKVESMSVEQAVQLLKATKPPFAKEKDEEIAAACAVARRAMRNSDKAVEWIKLDEYGTCVKAIFERNRDNLDVFALQFSYATVTTGMNVTPWLCQAHAMVVANEDKETIAAPIDDIINTYYFALYMMVINRIYKNDADWWRSTFLYTLESRDIPELDLRAWVSAIHYHAARTKWRARQWQLVSQKLPDVPLLSEEETRAHLGTLVTGYLALGENALASWNQKLKPTPVSTSLLLPLPGTEGHAFYAAATKPDAGWEAHMGLITYIGRHPQYLAPEYPLVYTTDRDDGAFREVCAFYLMHLFKYSQDDRERALAKAKELTAPREGAEDSARMLALRAWCQRLLGDKAGQETTLGALAARGDAADEASIKQILGYIAIRSIAEPGEKGEKGKDQQD